jgi:membrane protein implicated in regulation of membrane protease activity
VEWWAWLLVGAILLGSELTFVNAQFYLVFVGASCFVVGLLQLTGMGLAVWLQWLIFAALAVTSMVFFRRRIYERMRRKLPTMKHGPAGETVVLPAELKPGESCRLEYCGSSWDAVNGGKSPIAAGQRARIGRVDGLTLVVHGENS